MVFGACSYFGGSVEISEVSRFCMLNIEDSDGFDPVVVSRVCGSFDGL